MTISILLVTATGRAQVAGAVATHDRARPARGWRNSAGEPRDVDLVVIFTIGRRGVNQTDPVQDGPGGEEDVPVVKSSIVGAAKR